MKADFSMHHLMTERGVDLRYGRLLAGRLRAHGLIDVGAEGRMFMWEGGSLGANLLRMNCEQLRRAIIESGSLTEQEFQQDLRRLDEAEFMRPSPVMWAAWGRRPVKVTVLAQIVATRVD